MTATYTVFFDMHNLSELYAPRDKSVGYGGVEVQTARILDILAEDPRCEVVILADHAWTHPKVQVRVTKRPIQHGLPYISRLINDARKKEMFIANTERKILFQSYVNIDNVAHAKAQDVKTLIWLNSDSMVIDTEYFQNEEYRYLRSVWPQYDLVLSQTEQQKNALEKGWGINSRIIKPVVPDRGAPLASSEREYILWVGASFGLKRPWLFVELAKRNPHIRFLMVMSSVGDPSVKDTIKKEADCLSNISVLSDVPHNLMGAIYAKASIFVSTSIVEGMPNTFLEAAHAGVPIFSLTVNPSFMLNPESTGMCASDDFDLLSQSLNECIMNQDKLVSLQKSARAYSLTEWDDSAVVKSYIDAFDYLYE